MQSFTDAKDTLRFARSVCMERVSEAHAESVRARRALTDLKIEVHILAGLLQLALDYAILGIYSNYAPGKEPKRLIYPIITQEETNGEFTDSVIKRFHALPPGILHQITAWQQVGFAPQVLKRLSTMNGAWKERRLADLTLQTLQPIELEVFGALDRVEYGRDPRDPYARWAFMLDGLPVVWMLDFACERAAEVVLDLEPQPK